MNKIYDFKTRKLVAVELDPGEQQYLCKQNLKMIGYYDKCNQTKKEKSSK